MRIYFMGICGTAMGNAALLMRALDHEVMGSDTGIYPPMSDLLRGAGVDILEGWSAERLAQLKPDLVVVGNVASRGHPEVEWLLESRTQPYVSLPELLRTRLLNERRNVVVAGTHGKTTTTCMAAVLLKANGTEPGWLVGGVPRDLPDSSHPGQKGGPFVIEGDEYDTAFFDKRSKFIQYLPHVLAINNCEFDHADIFRDLDDVLRTFSHVIRIVPRDAAIVANGDDANVLGLVKNVTWAPVVRVGTGAANDAVIADFQESPAGSSFTLRWKGKEWGRVKWALPGLFNARNAAMAAASPAGPRRPSRPDGHRGLRPPPDRARPDARLPSRPLPATSARGLLRAAQQHRRPQGHAGCLPRGAQAGRRGLPRPAAPRRQARRGAVRQRRGGRRHHGRRQERLRPGFERGLARRAHRRGEGRPFPALRHLLLERRFRRHHQEIRRPSLTYANRPSA